MIYILVVHCMSMGEIESDDEASIDFLTWVAGRRRAILQAIRFNNGEANTTEIRSYTGLSRGSFAHHSDLLLDPPEKLRIDGDVIEGAFIEEAGEEDVGRPIPARVFALTELGESVFKKSLEDVGVDADEVHRLQQRVDDLEEEFASLEEKNEEFADFHERVAEVIDDRIIPNMNTLKEEYAKIKVDIQEDTDENSTGTG